MFRAKQIYKFLFQKQEIVQLCLPGHVSPNLNLEDFFLTFDEQKTQLG